ncbi:uncharacterized protein RMCT_2465 [Mycolicibacterium thermoresistibile]|uniref:Uncharacterized protein n=1 Tax=Mycolicibacterium thermoresistibile TaxID=1797 RepID=A0A100XF61_MYCTH|nr:uncharacterized protein RMCT_2465 [Mycolicibacterium thermoresistibile]
MARRLACVVRDRRGVRRPGHGAARVIAKLGAGPAGFVFVPGSSFWGFSFWASLSGLSLDT